MAIRVKRGVVWKKYYEIIASHEWRDFSKMMARNGLMFKTVPHNEHYDIVETWLPNTATQVNIGKFLFTEDM